MSNLISLEKLINIAKERGIDFGKGDPYNRLRYYTKIGWLPHMERKKDESGNIVGHYPDTAIERLMLIENLKQEGKSNEDISKLLKVKSRKDQLLELIKSKETRTQAILYSIFIFLVLIILNELGIVTLNRSRPKVDLTNSVVEQNVPKQVLDNGTAFIPKNQKKIFIQTPFSKTTNKIYVTFTSDYSPAVRYWISDIKDYDGFTVELDAPVFSNSEFNWWMTN